VVWFYGRGHELQVSATLSTAQQTEVNINGYAHRVIIYRNVSMALGTR